MYSKVLLATLSFLPNIVHSETILGAYIFHRHGDRQSKSLPPVLLTSLGYNEVYLSGQYLRQRYIESNTSGTQIAGISAANVVQSQIEVSTPDDVVLMTSAQGFLQGLYPPSTSTNALRNGTTVDAPMGGYQLIPIHTVTSTGSSSESAGWLQGSTGCGNAVTSSAEYYSTPEYMAIANSTASFYQGLESVISGVFTPAQASFKNAYTIFDYLNVGEIHNATLNTTVLTPSAFTQTRTLADTHEWNLAYNASAPVRAIAGATLAAQILQALNETVTAPSSSPKLNIQFGAYASFFSLFGLVQLPKANSDFMGIPDYASFMSFELLTNSTSATPAPVDIGVRFVWHNGTVSNGSVPATYPLFGQTDEVVPWSTFVSEMNQVAIGDQASWCTACGNSTGICASSAASTSSSEGGSNGGVSKAVAGVIGAIVALAVVLGLEALLMLLGGFRLRKKGTQAQNGIRHEKDDGSD